MNSTLDELNPLESWILKGKISNSVVYPAEMQVKKPYKNHLLERFEDEAGYVEHFRPEAKVSQSNWSFQEMARSFLLERSCS